MDEEQVHIHEAIKERILKELDINIKVCEVMKTDEKHYGLELAKVIIEENWYE